MGEVPARLLLFDSTQITAAAADLRTAFKQPGAIAELCAVFSTNQQPQVLWYVVVLSRTKFPDGKVWVALKSEDREQVKARLLQVIISGFGVSFRSAVLQLIGSIAGHELGAGDAGWPQLMLLI